MSGESKTTRHEATIYGNVSGSAKNDAGNNQQEKDLLQYRLKVIMLIYGACARLSV